MLILSRKIDESIVIDGNINIKVISIEKGIIKLGIDAPNDISIVRMELLEAVESSNKQATKVVPDSVLSSFADKFKRK